MNRKLKAVLLSIGTLAAILLISQLVMGLMIVSSPASPEIVKLIKMHQHTGYLTVTVGLAYLVLSMLAIVRAPGESKG